MTIPEATNILKLCLKWRQGEEIPMPDPKQFGEAIDLAISALSQNEVVGESKTLIFKSKV